jgi:SAM-dependent methyltransferase
MTVTRRGDTSIRRKASALTRLTPVGLRRLGVRTRLRVVARRIGAIRHWVGVRRLGKSRPVEYRDYLAIQLRRTLSKRETDPGVGAVTLINCVAEQPHNGGRVLCVGCRNALELDRFYARGFDDVTGIDVFSQREDIKVMDMHDMTFPDNSFDVVYASHVLEHSYDLERVVEEVVRVARDGAVVGVEVPVRVQASAADRIVFSSLSELRAAFDSHIGGEVLAEEQPPRSPTNDQGTDIARLVFRLRKEA